VIEFGEHTTERSCVGCGDAADFYLIVTDETVREEAGVELGAGEWPVNAMLCRECFADAPRVEEIGDLPGVDA
jgi:hypothetical protein